MRFLFVGDSVTEGMAPSLGRYVLSLGVEAEVVSRVGMSVEQAVTDELVTRGLRDGRPQATIVMLGTNPTGIMNLEAFRRSVMALRSLVLTFCGRLAWIGPWAGEDASERVEIIRAAVGFRVADGRALGAGLERAGEGNVHFHRDAYTPLAWRVAEWSVRVADPRALTLPRTGAKIVSVIGLLGAAGTPLVVGSWR